MICVGGAAGFAADKKVNLSGARVVGADLLAKQEDETDDDKDQEKSPAAAKPADKDEKPEGQKAVAASKAAEPDKKSEADAAPPDKKPAEKAASEPSGDKSKSKADGFDRGKIPVPVPGAIFRAALNRDHFLTYGYERDSLPVLVDTDQFLTLTRRGANVVTFPTAGNGADGPSLRVAGFEWPDNTERLLRGTAAVVEEPLGAGHVILDANGPSFRLLWRSSTRLWLNGVLYAPAIHGDED